MSNPNATAPTPDAIFSWPTVNDPWPVTVFLFVVESIDKPPEIANAPVAGNKAEFGILVANEAVPNNEPVSDPVNEPVTPAVTPNEPVMFTRPPLPLYAVIRFFRVTAPPSPTIHKAVVSSIL